MFAVSLSQRLIHVDSRRSRMCPLTFIIFCKSFYSTSQMGRFPNLFGLILHIPELLAGFFFLKRKALIKKILRNYRMNFYGTVTRSPLETYKSILLRQHSANEVVSINYSQPIFKMRNCKTFLETHLHSKWPKLNVCCQLSQLATSPGRHKPFFFFYC